MAGYALDNSWERARHRLSLLEQYLDPMTKRRPMTINALAADMVMDRTTLGWNILPLERDGLIAVERGRRDRRSKTLRLTEAGAARFREAVKEWAQAQKQFEAVFGAERTVDLRALLHAVAATDLGINAVSSEE